MTEIVNGIVIDSRIFREDDYLITLYTKEQGRVEAVARGARKISAKLRSHAQILSEVQAMIAQGKNLKHLASCYSFNLFPQIRSDYDKISAAWVFLEIFNQALKHPASDKNVYDLLKSWLRFLESYDLSDKKKLGTLSLLSASYLLIYLGSAPQFSRCVRCGIKLKSENTKFTAAGGGSVCHNCFDVISDKQVGKSSADIWRQTTQIDNINSFYKYFLNQEINSNDLDELNGLLLNFIEYRLEKQLNVRKYFI